MLDELGPTFVKFGQLLSTRPDLVPPDVIAELRGLQDDVSPFPFDQVARGRRGGARPHDRAGLPRRSTRRRSRRPRSARCTAPSCPTARGRRQGAAARRPAPDRVRPRSCSTRPPASSRERVRALEFIDAGGGRRVRALDPAGARLPASRRATPRPSGATSPAIRRVACRACIWRYTARRVLTLEWLEGMPAARSRPRRRTDGGAARARVPARRDLDEMIFRHGFFHADPHPANILVLDDGRIGLVDFGLAGQPLRARHEAADAPPPRLRDRERRARCRGGCRPRRALPAEHEEEFRRGASRSILYRYYGARPSARSTRCR